MATERQIEANRRNAQLSSGPRTEEGKARSRANALKHGLAGAGVVLDDEQAARVAERIHGYEIRTQEERWIYEQLVINSIRVEECRARELALRAYEAKRARALWDVDRAIEAEELAAGLSRRPERVAKKLAATAAGARWLLARWEALGRVEVWGEKENARAFDLLGVAEELRHGTPWASHGSPGALVASERARLSGELEGKLVPTDAEERSLAEQEKPARLSAEMRRLHRYEAACQRRVAEASRRLSPLDPAPAPVAAPPPPPPPPPTRVDDPPPPAAPRPAIAATVSSPLDRSNFIPVSATPAPAAERRPNRRARRAAARLARAGR